MLMLNVNINYGGRMSRLCYLIPLLVHSIFLYLVYVIYYSISLISFKMLLILFLIINIEWVLIICYEYIILNNSVISNNLLYNIGTLIFLEVLLFVGFYWLYINNIIHSCSLIFISNSLSYVLFSSISNCSISICFSVILYNLLLLLYVTLILQLVHRYLLINNSSNNIFISIFNSSLIFKIFSFNFNSSMKLAKILNNYFSRYLCVVNSKFVLLLVKNVEIINAEYTLITVRIFGINKLHNIIINNNPSVITGSVIIVDKNNLLSGGILLQDYYKVAYDYINRNRMNICRFYDLIDTSTKVINNPNSITNIIFSEITPPQ